MNLCPPFLFGFIKSSACHRVDLPQAPAHAGRLDEVGSAMATALFPLHHLLIPVSSTARFLEAPHDCKTCRSHDSSALAVAAFESPGAIYRRGLAVWARGSRTCRRRYIHDRAN